MVDSTESKKHRSPNYPYIGLRKAIELVTQIYEKDKRAKLPLNIVNKRWGYNDASSVGGQCVAALRAFGLLEVEGSNEQRRVWVSETALRYLVGREDNRKAILKECALRPTIYAQVWQHFDGEVPQEDVLRDHLIFNLNFNSNTVKQFVGPFRETIAFAGLEANTYTDGATDSESDSTGGEAPMSPEPITPPTGQPSRPHSVPAPVSPMASAPLRVVRQDERELRFHLPSGDVSLVIPASMGSDEFDILQAYLGAFKLSLAKSPAKVTDAQEN